MHCFVFSLILYSYCTCIGIGQGRITNNLKGAPIDYAIMVSDDESVSMVNIYAKQKHLGCKKVWGQSEATLQTGRRDQKV